MAAIRGLLSSRRFSRRCRAIPCEPIMAANNSAKKLLIVDDSAVERKLLTRLLQKHWPNYEIREAADGEEGLSAVEQ